MGRNKKINEIKILQGTDQPCRMDKNELNISKINSINQIANTKRLSILKTKRAKDIFKEKANQLINIGILSNLDFEQLAIYSHNLDKIFTCIEEFKKGMFKERFDENGNVVGFIENPYLKLYKELVIQNNKIGSEFGFSPLTRQKFSFQSNDNKPKLEDLLK